MGGKAHGGTFGNASNNNNQALGLSYDAAGNVTNYLNAYVYDPENRIQSGGGNIYTYDADGQRVMKSNSSGTPTKRYWMSGGNILAEADGSGNLTAEYVFFGGKRTVRIDLPANTVHYYLSDHLGSTSKVVNSAGVVEEESDFTPYGSELTAAQGTNHYKFTGKERDTETQLDYFGARYYTNLAGRFITPDWAAQATEVPYAEFADPQSLNLYTYVRNVPTVRIDPDGHCCEWAKKKVAETKQWAKDHPRTMSAVKAGVTGVATVGAVVAIVATAPVSVPTTLGAAAVAALTTTAATITATGGAVATVTYTLGAISGDTKGTNDAAEAVSTVTNPVGMAVTLATGSLDKGSKAAALSDLATGGKDALSHVDKDVARLGPAAAAAVHTAGAATAIPAAQTLASKLEKKDE